MKQKYLIVFAVVVVVSMLFFYFSNQTIGSKLDEIEKLDNSIKKEQNKRNTSKFCRNWNNKNECKIHELFF